MTPAVVLVPGLITYNVEIKTGNYEGDLDANVQLCIMGETCNTGTVSVICLDARLEMTC